MGATAAIANKVLFQITPGDAKELAPEFAEAPPSESRREPELVISQEPVADLLRRGHTNAEIQKFVTDLLRPWHDNLKRLKDEVDGGKLVKTSLSDEAAIYRDQMMLYQTDARIESTGNSKLINYGAVRDLLGISKNALAKAGSLHGQISEHSNDLLSLDMSFRSQQERLRQLDRFLVALMDGRTIAGAGQERFAQGLIASIGDGLVRSVENVRVLHLYILLVFGDPKLPRVIPNHLAKRHYMEKLAAVYLEQKRREWEKEIDRHYLGKVDMQDLLDYELKNLKRGYKVIKGWSEIRGYTHAKPEVKVPLDDIPDLPARVFTAEEMEQVKEICRSEIFLEHLSLDAIVSLKTFTEACSELSKPKNHILIPSGQYVWKEINTRSEADMVGEVVRKLTELPKYTAYTKILLDGGSTIWRGKIQTRKLEPQKFGVEMPVDTKRAILLYLTREFAMKRKEIGDEIRLRQGSWPGAGAEAQRPVGKRVEEQPGKSTTRPVGSPEEPPPQEA